MIGHINSLKLKQRQVMFGITAVTKRQTCQHTIEHSILYHCQIDLEVDVRLSRRDQLLITANAILTMMKKRRVWIMKNRHFPLWEQGQDV